jgi:exodeoxyribonuclease VII small subunit
MPPAAKNPDKNGNVDAGNPDQSAGLVEPADFETAMAELEDIVASMESGELSLEKSLAAHRRGLELAQYCQKVLARAQQQVKVLEDNALRALDELGREE